MKVALNAWFYNQIHTGSGQYLRYLIPALAELDPTLTLILVVPEFALADTELTWPEQVHIHPVAAKNTNLGKVWFEQSQFSVAAKAVGADIAHVPYFGSPLSPQLPTVVTVHDLIPMVLPEYRGGPLIRFYTSLVAAAATAADLILADSDASRQDILNTLNVPPAKVRTVYLAPAPHYSPVESWDEIDHITQKYNLPETFALYIGGYDVRKNLRLLLHAWTYVSAGLGDGLKLVLAGKLPNQDSSFFPDPLKLAQKLGIEADIITPGWIDEADKPLLYGAARVFVYPSLYEGFGLPVLEAMACGTPVVTTNVSSIPELTGPEAFQIDPNDSRHFASPIIALTIQDDTHNDMANRGYERSQQFTWQKTATQTLQAYKDIAS